MNYSQSYQIKIKPLSVNEAWRGRRFKTDAYNRYQTALLYLLPNIEVPEGRLILELEFGFSSISADIDNPIKMIQDCLQKKYKFNDKNIYKLIATKTIVSKGNEYIKFSINSY